MYCSCCQKQLTRSLTLQELVRSSRYRQAQCCETCSTAFHPLLKEKSCPTCQKQGTKGKVCQDCLFWKKQYPEYTFTHCAFFAYNDAFQEWLYRYKFLGDIRLAGTFAKELRQLRKEYRGFLICPLPVSTSRYEERGFDQVVELLRAACVPYRQLLVRVQHTQPQAEKNRKERLLLEQPYGLNGTKEQLEKQIRGRRVLLLDDVYTTGRTMFHAAEVLSTFRPACIRTFSLAR